MPPLTLSPVQIDHGLGHYLLRLGMALFCRPKNVRRGQALLLIPDQGLIIINQLSAPFLNSRA